MYLKDNAMLLFPKLWFLLLLLLLLLPLRLVFKVLQRNTTTNPLTRLLVF